MPGQRRGAASSTRLLSGFHTEPAAIQPRRQPARGAAATDPGGRAGAVRLPGRRGRRRRGASSTRRGARRRASSSTGCRRQRPGRSASPCSTGCCCGPRPAAPRCRPTCARRRPQAWQRLVATDGRIDVQRARRRGRVEPPPPDRAVHRRVRRSVRRRWPGCCGSSARSGCSCVADTADAGRRSRPSAATPTRPTWHVTGGPSPAPARPSGWPPSSCPSGTPRVRRHRR